MKYKIGPNGSHLYTWNGITDSLSGWSRRLGVSYQAIVYRIKSKKWKDQEVFLTVGHVGTSRRPIGSGFYNNENRLMLRTSEGCFFESRLIAAKALGRALPKKSIVHHVNEDPSDNRNCNLVICPDRAYHHLIHRRLRSVKAGFPPEWRRCHICKGFDSPEKMNQNTTHPACHRTRERERQAKKTPLWKEEN